MPTPPEPRWDRGRSNLPSEVWRFYILIFSAVICNLVLHLFSSSSVLLYLIEHSCTLVAAFYAYDTRALTVFRRIRTIGYRVFVHNADSQPIFWHHPWMCYVSLPFLLCYTMCYTYIEVLLLLVFLLYSNHVFYNVFIVFHIYDAHALIV